MTTTLTAPSTTPMTTGGVVEFKAIKQGVNADVRVSNGGVNYEQPYANWLTWTVVICSGGIAAFAWKWILFGRRSVTIPRAMVQGVEVDHGPLRTTLTVRSTTETVTFKTNSATAEAAQNVLLGG